MQYLVDYSTGTSQLLKQIRDHYLTEELARSSKALEGSMVALQTIAAATHTENSDMLQLAKHSRKDTLSLKILTRVTIIYLPATLVATIFSSDLIESQPTGQLVVRQQFWIYVLLTIGFTILTFVIPTMLEKRRARTILPSDYSSGSS
ncbi:hypothetical protein MMC10_009626 [Thelotrema lepadinum]|nr:hypothetical protein [Thelotrema lepadinum]